jgi:hypothetical protein
VLRSQDFKSEFIAAPTFLHHQFWMQHHIDIFESPLSAGSHQPLKFLTLLVASCIARLSSHSLLGSPYEIAAVSRHSSFLFLHLEIWLFFFCQTRPYVWTNVKLIHVKLSEH